MSLFEWGVNANWALVARVEVPHPLIFKCNFDIFFVIWELELWRYRIFLCLKVALTSVSLYIIIWSINHWLLWKQNSIWPVILYRIRKNLLHVSILNMIEWSKEGFSLKSSFAVLIPLHFCRASLQGARHSWYNFISVYVHAFCAACAWLVRACIVRPSGSFPGHNLYIYAWLSN